MEELIQESTNEITKPQPREKKTTIKSDNSGLKIQVPSDAAHKIQETYQTLKERGYTGKIEDILSVFWEQVTTEWAESRIEALTPDEYYLEAIRLMPEVRQKLVDQAKKALLKAKDDLKN